MSGQSLRRAEVVRIVTLEDRRRWQALVRAATVREVDSDDNRRKAAWAARTLR